MYVWTFGLLSLMQGPILNGLLECVSSGVMQSGLGDLHLVPLRKANVKAPYPRQR